jgi:hypothetical protein
MRRKNEKGTGKEKRDNKKDEGEEKKEKWKLHQRLMLFSYQR